MTSSQPDAAFLDNWTLQDVSIALMHGLSPQRTRYLRIDPTTDTHSWDPTPEAATQVQCFLDLILDVVLRDHTAVVEQHTGTWAQRPTALTTLLDSGTTIPVDLPGEDERIWQKKQVLLTDLCATSTLRQVQEENRASYSATGQSIHGHESALIWGGAGNLARASALSMVYSAHPYRRRLFEQTVFPVVGPDAMRGTIDWVQRHRTRLLQQLLPDRDRRLAVVDLPPIAAEVILASSSPSDLILNAVQAREDYRKVRSWLQEYQRAMDEQDPKALARHKATLDAVARDLEALTGRADTGTSFAMTVGVFSLPLPVQAVADVVGRRFGVRAVFNRLILSSRSADALDHLLGLFGEKDSHLGQEVRRHFLARAADTLLPAGDAA